MNASTLEAQKQSALQAVLIIFLVSVPIGLIAGFTIGKKLSKPFLQLRKEISLLAEGQIPDNSHDAILANQMGEIGDIGRLFNALKEYMAEMAQTADSIAAGDLTTSITIHS